MKVAKRFRWEAAHRLPWHEGACRNLHGHSYRMLVELEGEVGANGMVIDFHDIKRLVGPTVEAWDHALLVAESDGPLMEIAATTGWKSVTFPFDTTVENLCTHVVRTIAADHGETLRNRGIRAVTVRIEETETCYAEVGVQWAP